MRDEVAIQQVVASSGRRGYSFGQMYSARTGKAYLGFRPSKKSIGRMVETIHALTARTGTWQETTELVAKLNRTLRGWANYFQVGTVTKAYRAIKTCQNRYLSKLRLWMTHRMLVPLAESFAP